jgi:predicted Zn finger-like uncharacterized protein
MIATCPKCSVRYRIAKEKLKPEGVRMRCARCETVFRVRPPTPAPAPAATPSPSMPQEEAPPMHGPGGPMPQREVLSTEPPGPSVPQGEAPPAERLSAPAPDRPRAAPKPEPETVDRERLALVAIPDGELAKQSASVLAAGGLHTSVVHDGVEAMLEVQRQLPRVVILSASLPKMYGFQICEVMKRNENLRSIPVVLVGTIANTDRYRR